MKLKLIALLSIALSITLYISSCQKTEDLSRETLAVKNLQYHDTVKIGGQIKSETSVSLGQCPFKANEIFITGDDRTDWDYNSIKKYTYLSTSIIGYFVKDKNDDLKSLVIFYNPDERKKLKMVITGTKMDKKNVRYQYSSTSGEKHFEITIKDDKEGYNVKIGNSPDFNSLGQSRVEGIDQLNPISGQAAAEQCFRTDGFKSCMVCSSKECSESWWCIITCGVGGPACVAGWIVACAALNAD